MEFILHSANIVIHIITGIFSLIMEFIILIKSKGNTIHKMLGRWFIYSMVFVILTGIIGVIIFQRNLFLLLITILVGYNTYSGIRIVRNKTINLKAIDIFVMIAAIFITFYFLHYLNAIGFYWSPVIIYSTIGYLFLVITYDILRYFIPKSKCRNLWMYEHSSKMISAIGGLLSAFVGTILPDLKPYSQFLPSLVMTMVMFFYIVRINKNTQN